MIRTELIGTSNRHQDFEDECRPMLPQDFFRSPRGSAAGYLLLEDGKPFGFASSGRMEPQTVMLKVWFSETASFRQMVQAVSVLAERAVKLHHPQKIACLYASGNARKVMNSCMFYQKGTGYCRLVEPYRALIPDAAFDAEGMIINQALLEEIPFGWFDSKAKGCGWIAAYNLLKINGREMRMEDVIKGLDEHAVLGQVMGQNEVLLGKWLNRQGLKVHRTLPSDRLCGKRIPQTSSGILLYTHKAGAHYAAYRVRNDGRIQLFNAVYGRTEYIVDADAFLKEHSLFPVSSLLYVK